MKKKNHLTIDFRATGSIRKVWFAKNLADEKDLRNKFGLQKFGREALKFLVAQIFGN